MKLICGECRNAIPEGMDFCPRCGCTIDHAMALDDGNAVGRICPSCGNMCSRADTFCGGCGTRLPPVAGPGYTMQVMNRRGGLALVLGLIPGFFNIFGLGHLVLKQYSRGVMFLVMTAVLWYLNGWQLFSQSFLVSVLSITLFFYQALDLMRHIYVQGGQ